MLQASALEILKMGVNVFLTGEPGSGKTHLVNEYVAYLKAHGITPAITASTGVASTHIGGMTIHSWAGIGIKENLSKEDVSKLKANKKVTDRINRARVLIIDEVSMLSPNTLSMIESVCRIVRGSHDVFGGIQVVLVGDFFQLPPVKKFGGGFDVNSGEQEMFAEGGVNSGSGTFAYDSPLWDRAKFVTCYLTEQYRQEDEIFLSLLSAIRRGEFKHGHLLHIEKRRVESRAVSRDVPKLFTHNLDVDRVNDEELLKINGEAEEFIMTSTGNAKVVDALIKGCLSPEVLELKVGAVVMFTKNNRLEKFVNGTLGVVTGFDADTGYPIVRIKNGKEIEVSPMDWAVEDNGKVVAKITQVPLRLAWAITVHKSQGMSLDEAFMDLGGVFEFGQGYVALSRLRGLKGLHIAGWNERAFMVHPEVLAEDMRFRERSKKAEERISSMPEVEVRKLQEDFIVACGGKIIKKDDKNVVNDGEEINGYSEIRKTYPNAYKRWSEEDDERLIDLYVGGASVKEIVEIMGRKKGGITSRLKKVGLIEE